jgi:hypothetical protein
MGLLSLMARQIPVSARKSSPGYCKATAARTITITETM